MQLRSEAGIVNYYRPKSTMGGHRDDLELTFEEPVVSISCGCTAVFLIGGASRDVPPVPLVLESGDVVVMGGASRLFYHGTGTGTGTRSTGGGWIEW